MKYGMLWSKIWKWRVKDEIRCELKVVYDSEAVKEGFVLESGCVLISDSMACDQGEGKDGKWWK